MSKLPNLQSLKIWGILDYPRFATSEVKNKFWSDLDLVGQGEDNISAYDIIEHNQLASEESFMSNDFTFRRVVPVRINNPSSIFRYRISGEDMPSSTHAFIYDANSLNSFRRSMSEITSEYTTIPTNTLFIRNLQVSGVAYNINRDFSLVLQIKKKWDSSYTDQETLNISLSDGNSQFFKFQFFEVPKTETPYIDVRVKLVNPSNFPAKILKVVDEVSGFWGKCNIVKLEPNLDDYDENNVSNSTPFSYINQPDCYQSGNTGVLSNSQNTFNLEHIQSIHTDKFWMTQGKFYGGAYETRCFSVNGNNLIPFKTVFHQENYTFNGRGNFNSYNGSVAYSYTELPNGKPETLVTYIKIESGGSVSASIVHYDGATEVVDLALGALSTSTTNDGARTVKDLSVFFDTLPNFNHDFTYFIRWEVDSNQFTKTATINYFVDTAFEDPYYTIVQGSNSVDGSNFNYDPNALLKGYAKQQTINTIPSGEIIAPGYSPMQLNLEREFASGLGPFDVTTNAALGIIRLCCSPNTTTKSGLYVFVPHDAGDQYTNGYIAIKGGTTNPLGGSNFYNLPLTYYSTPISENPTITLARPHEKIYGTFGGGTVPNHTYSFHLEEVQPTIKTYNLVSQETDYTMSDLISNNFTLCDFTSISGGPAVLNLFDKSSSHTREFYISKDKDTYKYPMDDPTHVHLTNQYAFSSPDDALYIYPGGDPDEIPASGGYTWQANSIMLVNKTGTKFKVGDYVKPRHNSDGSWEWIQARYPDNAMRLKILKKGFVGSVWDAYFWGLKKEFGSYETLDEPSYKISLGTLTPGQTVRVFIRTTYCDLRRGYWS
jgi:hypothetical protein